ncbi:MAG: Hsp20/alpha crystallin family protein [Candidatus Acidiferrales bacterium]
MTHHSSHASHASSSMKSSTDLNLVSIHELFEHTQDVFNLIARRAFEIFESRGHVQGNDREDWFHAESELLTPVKFHISESGEQLIAHAEVPGFNREEIKVSLEPHRLTISGKAEASENHQSGKHVHSIGHTLLVLRIIDLPCEVDLSKAKATFNEGALEVVMPKAAPAKSVRVETKPALSAESDASVDKTDGIETPGGSPVFTGTNGAILKARAASSRR